ncbi:MAG: isoleucine--tRNA ligase [Endomicrobium sp.]|jgi:isoleucyl-tRNA synthetase|nr:isoleucine--tRNA ligase [Endomicrobium sp.]
MNEEKNYSKTINLPKTNFKMKANLTINEQSIIDEWENKNIYYKICKKNKHKKKFILHDGPPYANAHIHIGTALNKVLKDFIIKYRSMSGYFVPFIPGWDCHGLPIEQLVLKEMKIHKNEIKKVDFRKFAANFAKKFIEIQKYEFKRLGIIADWNNPYLTLDYKYESSVINVFNDLLKNGFIYRKKKPVYWCLTCETAMAEAEVEYENFISDSIFIKFKIIFIPDSLKLKKHILMDFSFLVWTTTPWTIPSNVAIAFNRKSKYVAVIYKFNNEDKNEEKLIIVENLVEKIMDKIKATSFDIVMYINGDDIIGLKCRNPLFFNKQSKCVVADFVDIKEGTGIVHIAPGHGYEDYQVGVEHNLEILSPVNSKGFYTEEIPEFCNIHIFDANQLIINKLEEKKTILAKFKINHSYPHCWRCKKPIIFRATPQWFLSMKNNGLIKKLLKLSENVNWIPKYGKNRMVSMIKNRPDWCLSRQRFWGVPIPVFYCKKCGEPLLNSDVIDKVAILFADKGSNSWFEINEDDMLKKMNLKCSFCNSIKFKKEDDIFDVWFDSGVSYEAVLLNKNYGDLDYPADLYLEGSDQHRGWFQSSMIPSVATSGIAPYKNVLTHGFVVDGEGKKMSKSVGNVLSSDQLVNKYGADIIRFWIASSDYKEDIKISDKIISRLVDIYRKIRNTIRFLLGNIIDIDINKMLPFKDMNEIDKYALSNLQELVSKVTLSYEKYEFYKVTSLINNFCTVFLSGFYLDVSKDVLYCDKKYSKNRVSVMSAMYKICSSVIKLISPILSFTAEEAWKEICKSIYGECIEYNSIFFEDFPMPNYGQILENKTMEKWKKILDVRKSALIIYEKLRKSKIINSNFEASLNIVYGNEYFDVFKDSELINIVLGTCDIRCFFLNGEKKFSIEATMSKLKKCLRCWRYIPDVENNLCFRCREVLLTK